MNKSIFLAILLFFSGCSLNHSSDEVNVHFVVDRPQSSHRSLLFPIFQPPTSPTDLECFFLSLSGAGISANITTADTSDIDVACLGLSRVTPVVSPSTLTTDGISVKVKPGLARTIKLIGVGGTEVSGCDGATTVSEIFRSIQPFLYLLGRTTTNLLADKTVALENIYTSPGSSTPTNLVGECKTTENRTLSAALGFEGGVSQTTAFISGETLSGTLPPTNTGQITNTPLISDSDLYFKEPGAMNPAFARVDVLFDLSNIQLNLFSSVEITGTVQGGFTSFTGTCGTTFTSDSGVEVAIYNADESKWTQMSNATSGSGFKSFTFSPSPSLDDLKFSETLNGTTKNYLHVSLREKAGGFSAQCSALKIRSISATLSP